MTKREAFDVLRPQLTSAIQAWMDSVCETEAWVSLEFYIGNDGAACMSAAALSVLEGVVDVQDYLKEDERDAAAAER